MLWTNCHLPQRLVLHNSYKIVNSGTDLQVHTIILLFSHLLSCRSIGDSLFSTSTVLPLLNERFLLFNTTNRTISIHTCSSFHVLLLLKCTHTVNTMAHGTFLKTSVSLSTKNIFALPHTVFPHPLGALINSGTARNIKLMYTKPYILYNSSFLIHFSQRPTLFCRLHLAQSLFNTT